MNKLAIWEGKDGYKYLIVRLHDEDEERIKKIEKDIEDIKKCLEKR